MTTIGMLAAVFTTADSAWDAELVRLFGPESTAARYEKRGRGSLTDGLGRLYVIREKARIEWEAVTGDRAS